MTHTTIKMLNDKITYTNEYLIPTLQISLATDMSI